MESWKRKYVLNAILRRPLIALVFTAVHEKMVLVHCAINVGNVEVKQPLNGRGAITRNQEHGHEPGGWKIKQDVRIAQE